MHCLMDVDLHKIENESPDYDIYFNMCFEPRASLSYFVVCHCLSPQTSAFQCKDTQAKNMLRPPLPKNHVRSEKKKSVVLCYQRCKLDMKYVFIWFHCHPRLQSTKKTMRKSSSTKQDADLTDVNSLYTKQHPNNQPPRPTSLRKKKSLIKNSTYITLGLEKPSVTRLKGHF